MPEISKEKQDILNRALQSPDSPNSRIVIAKAKERGWLPQENKGDGPDYVKGAIYGASKAFGPVVPALAGAIEGIGEAVGQGAGFIASGGKGPLPESPVDLASKKIGGIVEKQQKYTSETPRTAKVAQVATSIAPFAAASTAGKTLLEAAGLAPKLAGTISGGAVSGAYGALENISDPNKKAADDLLRNVVTGAVLSGASEYGPGLAKVALEKGSKLTRGLYASIKGIRPDTIKYYAENRKQVNEALKQSLDDLLPQLWGKSVAQVDDFVKGVNSELDTLVRNSDKVVNAKPVIDAAQKALNEASRVQATSSAKGAASAIEAELRNLAAALPEDGNVAASTLHSIKKQFQQLAQSFYENKQIGVGDAYGKAMAEIAKQADGVLDTLSPAVKTLNDKLRLGIQLQQKLKIGDITKAGMDLNRARSIYASTQPEILKWTKQLDELTGSTLHDTSRLYKTFQDLKNEDILGMIRTGRILIGPALGAAAGGTTGSMSNASVGGLLGAIAQTPIGTRPMITGATAVKGLIGRVLPAIGGAKYATPAVQEVMNSLERRGK